MRNGIGFLVIFLSLSVFGAMAQAKKGSMEESVTYKWVQNGVVTYSYTVPSGVTDYEVINKKGAKKSKTEDDGSFKIVKPTGKIPNNKENKGAVDTKSKNCEVAKYNKNILSSGVVFEKDDQGEIKEVSDEAKKAKLVQAEKDMSYFCE